jgi:hypothetical protein
MRRRVDEGGRVGCEERGCGRVRKGERG